MNFKKKVNGSWTDIPHYIHKTSTDTIATLPAVIFPNAATATVGLKGNMSQSGTPTSTTPIQPSECGERTGNLFDKNATDTNNGYVVDGYLTSGGTINTNNDYRTSEYIPILSNQKYITYAAGLNVPSVCFYDANKNYISGVNYAGRQYAVFTTPSDAKYVRLSFKKVDKTIMFLNLGDTALSYEPYGYKLDISSANTTTPVYLGEVESARRIKKLVLDGVNDGEWKKSSTRTGSFYLTVGTNAIVALGLCDRAINVNTIQQYDSIGKMFIESSGSSKLINLWLFDTNISLDDFKSYLAAQYAAGTPVCVWYVLATETTAIVNEPLRKIGEYADTVSNVSIPVTAGGDSVDIETTVKPSEVSLTYTGWHDAQCKEYDGSQWV